MRNYDPNDVNEPDWDCEPEEVERCECGEVATVKCGRERFCISCQLDIDRANLSVEDEAVRMNSEGAD